MKRNGLRNLISEWRDVYFLFSFPSFFLRYCKIVPLLDENVPFAAREFISLSILVFIFYLQCLAFGGFSASFFLGRGDVEKSIFSTLPRTRLPELSMPSLSRDTWVMALRIECLSIQRQTYFTPVPSLLYRFFCLTHNCFIVQEI